MNIWVKFFTRVSKFHVFFRAKATFQYRVSYQVQNVVRNYTISYTDYYTRVKVAFFIFGLASEFCFFYTSAKKHPKDRISAWQLYRPIVRRHNSQKLSSRCFPATMNLQALVLSLDVNISTFENLYKHVQGSIASYIKYCITLR